jgi:hypothetical protein
MSQTLSGFSLNEMRLRLYQELGAPGLDFETWESTAFSQKTQNLPVKDLSKI